MGKITKPITNEIATIENDIFQDYLGKIQTNPDRILRTQQGGKGIELYEDLLTDDKVGSTLQTRRLAVIGKEWEILPVSDKRQDVRIAEYVKQVLLGFDFDGARKALLSGIVLGYKPAEVMWGYSEGDVYIEEITGKPARRFVFGLDRRLRLLTRTSMIEGEEVPDRKFIVYRNTSDNGSPYGDGTGRMLYWPVWFKKNDFKFWLIFAEKFGSPTVVGKYPTGTLKAEQDRLLEACGAIQQDAAIIIPDTMLIDLIEATRSGSVTTYETLLTKLDGAIAQVMLGQTLTSDIGQKGSYAAASAHEDVRQDYIKADADSMALCMNTSLIPWIVDYNFPVEGAGRRQYPKFWIRTEREKDLKPLAERDRILVSDIGLPVAKKYFYDTYGIPEPEENEDLVNVLKTDTKGVGEKAGNDADVSGKKDGDAFKESILTPYVDTQRGIDTLTASALKEGAIDLAALYRIVDEAVSYEDLQARIAEAYQDIDMTRFEELISRALFMADMHGRTLS